LRIGEFSKHEWAYFLKKKILSFDESDIIKKLGLHVSAPEEPASQQFYRIPQPTYYSVFYLIFEGGFDLRVSHLSNNNRNSYMRFI